MTESTYHVPVMASEVVELLCDTPPGPLVDGTCGGGGHTRALRQHAKDRQIIAIDRDMDAICETERSVSGDAGVTLVRGNFSDLRGAVKKAGYNASHEVAGILLDLGVSSWQLDSPGRGFAFHHSDSQLDMRMDQSGNERTAAMIIRDLSVSELAKVLREYGDVSHAGRMASALKQALDRDELHTTGDLARVVESVRGKPRHRERIHPATTVFQALRMAVNGEMDALEQALDVAPDLLMPGGRMVIISYHSGEDRRTKQAFRYGEQGPQVARHLPEPSNFKPTWKVLTRRPMIPTDEEIARNPRARSAKLRAAERTGEGLHV